MQQAAAPTAATAAAAAAADMHSKGIGSQRRPPLPFPQQMMLHDDDAEGANDLQQQQQQQQVKSKDVQNWHGQHHQQLSSMQQPAQSPAGRLLAPAFADIISSQANLSPVVPPTVESLKQLEQQQATIEQQQQQQDGPEISQLTWSASFRSSHCGSDGASTYFYSVHTASKIGSSSARYANIWEGLGQDASMPAGLLAAVGAEDRAALLAAAAAAGRWRGKRRSSNGQQGGYDAAAFQALQQAAARLLQGGGRVPRPNVTGTALE
jgi:hypothetical protein